MSTAPVGPAWPIQGTACFLVPRSKPSRVNAPRGRGARHRTVALLIRNLRMAKLLSDRGEA